VAQKSAERQQSEETKQSRWGLRGKTVWDWLQLFIVPLVLVGIGLLFEMQQADRQQATEDQQQALEERRAEAERELAEQRAQDEALQAYFDQMSGLILDRDLLTSEDGDSVRLLARARTITILRRLDSVRNFDILQFLQEAQLISVTNPVVRLDRSNLSGADLSGVDLSGADLRFVVASGTNMSGTNMNGTDLSYALSVNADLSGADLSVAILRGAILRGADLRETYLIETDLSDADLGDAHLRDANLSGANLRDASGITDEQLEEQAKTLEGATMPNGQKYEDWLKSKGSGENGENGGSS
jgi:uncharacterized protein YjbI with pentapeptide repeats